jgi:transposase
MTMKTSMVQVTETQRRLLAAWARAGTTPQRVATRASIVLRSAEGDSVRAIADQLRVNPRTVMLWQRRFKADGTECLWRDAPGRGRKPTLRPDAVTRLRGLLASPPPDGRRWSVRRLAEATGLSPSSVHRISAAERRAPKAAGHRRRKRHLFVSAAADDMPL